MFALRLIVHKLYLTWSQSDPSFSSNIDNKWIYKPKTFSIYGLEVPRVLFVRLPVSLPQPWDMFPVHRKRIGLHVRFSSVVLSLSAVQ